MKAYNYNNEYSTVVGVVLWLIAMGVILLTWILETLWLRPKRIERLLRQQGLDGYPYRLWHGDLKQMKQMTDDAALLKPIDIFQDHDILPHVAPFHHHILQKYGKKCFMWNGGIARVIVMEPELIRDILSKYKVYQKSVTLTHPLSRLLVSGLVSHEDLIWANHRRILNPAFRVDKIKHMLPEMYLSCSEMMNKWETSLINTNDGKTSSIHIDVWPYLTDLSADVISRAAFGSSCEEGKTIFALQTELAQLTFEILQSTYIPGWRFLPTKTNRRMKAIHSEVCSVMRGIIHRREKATKLGEAHKSDDLLSLLMESNSRELNENHKYKKRKSAGITIDEVIDECKLFYFAGQETTSNLLTWTMVMLSVHQNWQAKARQEVVQILGDIKQPDLHSLNNLKIVNMILFEVLRLYPPATMLLRMTREKSTLGDITLPPQVELLLPIVLLHHDTEIWGKDAKEFKPERFSEGVERAAKTPAALFSFSSGPRVCIGQHFAMLETKMAIAMILQRFSFELSPSYKHAPCTILSLQPRYGAKMILHRI